MNTKYLFLLAAAGSLWFQSCDKDDYDSDPKNDLVQQSFLTRYANAERVDWDRSGSYYVADFRYQNSERSAWFDAQGNWWMTETDLTLMTLPDAVRQAFLNSAYASWRVEEVNLYERPDTENIYVIELEQGKQEAELIYTIDGMLVNTLANSGKNPDHFLLQTLPTAVQTFIDSQYPGAKIVDTEQEMGRYEVDIRHDNQIKELFFNSDWSWIRTQWDIRPSLLPDSVLAALTQQVGNSYRIDDVDYVTTPTAIWYQIEIERFNGDLQLKITPEGQLIP